MIRVVANTLDMELQAVVALMKERKTLSQIIPGRPLCHPVALEGHRRT